LAPLCAFIPLDDRLRRGKVCFPGSRSAQRCDGAVADGFLGASGWIASKALGTVRNVMTESRRSNEREVVTLPVKVEGIEAGQTRNLSAGGIYFESAKDIAEGATLHLTLELTGPDGPLLLHCTGEVVRVEKTSGRTGVAVKIIESRLEKAAPATT
jgi:hypothetical protein